MAEAACLRIGAQLVEERLVQIDREHPGLQGLGQHQGLPAGAAAEVEHAPRGRQWRQAAQRRQRARVAARPLARQALEQAKEGSLVGHADAVARAPSVFGVPRPAPRAIMPAH